MAASNPATHDAYSIRKNIVSLEIVLAHIYIFLPGKKLHGKNCSKKN